MAVRSTAVRRVTFLPVFSKKEGYQDQLAQALQRLGLDVTLPPCRTLPLLTLLRRWKPDVLHLHWLHSFFLTGSAAGTAARAFMFLMKIVALKLLGVRIVWTVHNLWNHEKVALHVDRQVRLALGRLADAIIVHGTSVVPVVAQAYRIRHRDKITVIPPGNYVDYYTNCITATEARCRLQIQQDRFVFLFLGALRRYKGILNLITAFKTAPDTSLLLLIAGKPHDNALNTEIADAVRDAPNIRFAPGFVAEDDVQSYMNAANVVVFPYVEVLTSAAAVLALSFGRPVIAPRLGCLNDVLDEAGSFLYDSHQPDGLRLAMHTAFAQRDRLEAMGRHNRRIAGALSWEHIGAQTLNVYRSASA